MSAFAARSGLLRGELRHRRVRPKPHDFSYNVWHALLDLDELATLDRAVAGFGHNRRALASIRDTDHLGEVDLPLREKLRRYLGGQGVTLPEGRVLLQTSLRVLGYVFNPVSFFYCYDRDGRLALVVAEVNNTFGDTHCYVLNELERTGEHTVVAHDTKLLHVSPFMPVDGQDYRFVFRPPTPDGPTAHDSEPVVVHMDSSDAEGHIFDATLAQQRITLTSQSLRRILLRMPFVTLKTIIAIHWEALFIWRRKAPFHRRPAPPATGYDAIATAVHEARTRDAPDAEASGT